MSPSLLQNTYDDHQIGIQNKQKKTFLRTSAFCHFMVFSEYKYYNVNKRYQIVKHACMCVYAWQKTEPDGWVKTLQKSKTLL